MQVITVEQAWNAIHHRLLLTIAASFSLGAALRNTHVSANIASALIATHIVLGPFGFLLAIFICTSLLSCVVSNSATVVLLYSVLREVDVPGLGVRQMLTSMMLGASCAFATPIGCNTNLMVLSAGGCGRWRQLEHATPMAACPLHRRPRTSSQRKRPWMLAIEAGMPPSPSLTPPLRLHTADAFSDFLKLGSVCMLTVGATTALLIWLIGLVDPSWAGGPPGPSPQL